MEFLRWTFWTLIICRVEYEENESTDQDENQGSVAVNHFPPARKKDAKLYEGLRDI